MKDNALLLLFIMTSVFAMSQSVSTHLISNGGAIYETSNNKYQWTVGEVAVGNHDGDIKISEGFQQVFDLGIVSVNEKKKTFDVSIFPNPAQHNFTIVNYSKLKLSVIIYDLLGREINHIENINQKVIIDISSLKIGSYYVKLIDNQGFYNIHKLIKI